MSCEKKPYFVIFSFGNGNASEATVPSIKAIPEVTKIRVEGGLYEGCVWIEFYLDPDLYVHDFMQSVLDIIWHTTTRPDRLRCYFLEESPMPEPPPSTYGEVEDVSVRAVPQA